MEASPKMLAEHGELDVRSVHWDDDDRAFLTGSSVEVFGVIELPTSVRQNETDEFVEKLLDGMMKSRKNLKEVSLCRTLFGGSGERCSFQST